MIVPLTVRQGAGLFLVRRARTIAAPHQVRLVVTAFLALLVVDLGRLHLSAATTGSDGGGAVFLAEGLAYAAVAVSLWRLPAGLCLAAGALGVGAAVGGTGLEPVLLLVLGVLVGVRGERRTGVAYAGGVLLLAGTTVLLHPAHVVFVLAWFAGSAAVGLAAGSTAARLRRGGAAEDRSLAEDALEDLRIRGDERRVLAAELHDVVTHQLSTMSLQVMGHADSHDVDELRVVLRKVGRSADSALAELRLLNQVLHADPTTAPTAAEVPALSQRLAPTAAAAGWARRLVEAGLDPVIEVPGRADRIGVSAQATLVRALDAVGENFLGHAPPRARCEVVLRLTGAQAVLRASSPLGDASPSGPVRLGWGLRGLRERVHMSGGTFLAQPVADEGAWVVAVSLPLD